jgi:hypothetical protein
MMRGNAPIYRDTPRKREAERGRRGGVKSIPRQRLVWIYKEKDIMIQM